METHSFNPWPSDLERCNTCDRPVSVHLIPASDDVAVLRVAVRGEHEGTAYDVVVAALDLLDVTCEVTELVDENDPLGCVERADTLDPDDTLPDFPAPGDRHGAAGGQATLPAILTAVLIAAGLVVTLHVGVVATAHQLLAWGW